MRSKISTSAPTRALRRRSVRSPILMPAQPRSRSATWDNSLPSRFLSTWRRVFRWARLLMRSMRPSGKLACLPPFMPAFKARLLLSRVELSVIALVGIILLIGIVKKNAIMMIDFALIAEREEGKSALDAIYEACLLRFRPIMMTTMAALFGALPLALSSGMGYEFRRPLGITIVGGLILSQAMTLYTTPVVYVFFDQLAGYFRHAPARHALANGNGRLKGPA